MATRVFLLLSAVVWLPYGLYCFFDPAYLSGAAGIGFLTPTGSTELRAMYGGLQSALGVLALGGATRGALTRPALVGLAFVTGGLGSTRLLGAIIDGGWSGYTFMGLVFEWLSAAIAAWLLRRPPA